MEKTDSVSLYGLSKEDKQLIRKWVAEMKEWNNPYWEPTEEGRAGYEKALRHLLNALNNKDERI